MDDYNTHAKGVRILPGQWRPHYPWEHIAWVSPTWPCQDYLWLDVPEAVFTERGLIYLSHVNPRHPSLFENLPRVQWQTIHGGISFERTLPDVARFGLSVTHDGPDTVALHLFIENISDQPLRDIMLQTCVYLRAVDGFNTPTNRNKFVHMPDRGWVMLDEALDSDEQGGQYHVGWRSGPKCADLPIMLTANDAGDRFIALTWADHTFSLIGNPQHPCMHADPTMPDIDPGARHTLEGKLIFFQGPLDAFDEAYTP